MSRRSRIVGFGSAGLLVLAGVISAVALSAGLGEVLALVLISLGAILAVSLVFLEVGLSEDRERAREEAARVRRDRTPRDRPLRPARPKRSRLGRMRGHPRRLR
jgi:hypothetical protein